jgi:drug/metabolite transporter (DMT)-like permease
VKELLSGRSAPGREQAWFALGALLILIHTVDDTIAPGEVDIAPGVIEATAVVAAILYRMVPWFVALLAALFVGITRLGRRRSSVVARRPGPGRRDPRS